MRSLEIWDAEVESPREGFACDAAAMAVAADEGRAFLRLWRRRDEGVALGRYHRLAPGSVALERRSTGGRAIPVDQGVLGLTLVLPDSAWLAPSLRPEQIPNRALRPLLSLMRAMGHDAFYAGRDLVTVARRPVAHASFTVAPDGIVVVEMHLALETSFACLGERMAAGDPGGVAAVDALALGEATTLAELDSRPRSDRWAQAMSEHTAAEFGCDASVSSQRPTVLRQVTPPDEAAFEAMRAERGPRPDGHANVASVTMLGAVEVSGVVAGGHVSSLEITGDLLAPFETLDALSVACEGRPAAPAAIGRAVTSVLSSPGRFVLGIRDLGELIGRLS